MRFIAAVLAIALGAGCSTKMEKRPALGPVCVEVSRMETHEVEFILKRAKESLTEYGFTMASSGCDLTLRYTAFGDMQGQATFGSILGLTARGVLSHDGVLTIVKRGDQAETERAIELRAYSSRMDVLHEVAASIVRPVLREYRPAP